MKNLNITVSRGGKRYTTDKVYRQLITSREWVRLRKQKLWRDPLCERCKEGDV